MSPFKDLLRRFGGLLPILAAGAALAHAGQTRSWMQGEYADFEKGVIKNLSLRSDGRLTLAPRSQELYDTPSAYLWALAHDSKGNLYAGGGPGAKLFRISPKGEKKSLAELEGLEIHSMVVDAKDRVYAATSPDGKVYRVSPNGKAEVFYDPKTKYIWAMAFNSKGDLFVATGDQGEIHRVGPDGKGRVFFKSDETHARSMVVDPNDNLIVGTDPGGLVLRVSPAGEGFVLYQMSKKEVTAVIVARDGSVYASAVGTKQAAPPQAPILPAPAPAPAPMHGAGAAIPVRPASPPPATLAPGGPAGVSGGSEVYRIDPAGNPRKVWNHAQDIVYTIGFDGAGRALLGAGNKGYIYRIDSEALYTALLNLPSTQITAFQANRDGRLYVATGNVGKVYEIGPELEREGSIESDVFDAGIFSLWGRLSFDGDTGGGKVTLVARSGNLDQPQKNWSRWSAPITSPKGARVTAPPARFAQWKATLAADAGGHTPQLEAVELAYLPKNVEPRVEEIETTPANYKFPTPSAASASPQTLTLPPIGKRSRGDGSSISLDSTPSMQYAKGFLGARWAASDPNGDAMIYTVQIRGANEKEWKLLKDKVKEKYLSWDSTTFADGEYVLRVIASDLPSNPPPEALSARFESDTFLIDNTPPQISGLTATRSGDKVRVHWKASDALNNIKRAEYSMDGGDWTVASPVTKLSDSPELEYDLTIDGVSSGEHTIAVRAEDQYDNQAADKVVLKP